MTPDQARAFFLSQDTETIIDAYAKMIEANPDDVQLRVDWGTDDHHQVIGGDIMIGPKFGGRLLDDDDLVSLALLMGAEDTDPDPTWRLK